MCGMLTDGTMRPGERSTDRRIGSVKVKIHEDISGFLVLQPYSLLLVE